MVPLLKDTVSFQEKAEDSPAYLVIKRENWAERLSVKFLKQPSVRKIQLDKDGEFAVRQIVKEMTVEEIAGEIKAHFGNEAEPILPRLVRFLDILESQEWITWKE
nr:PqqD family protein [Metabacillus kandeliae]